MRVNLIGSHFFTISDTWEHFIWSCSQKTPENEIPECYGAGEGSDQGQAAPDIGEEVIMDLTVS